VSASVETFSYLAIVVLVVWAEPDMRWRRYGSTAAPTPVAAV
jgi:hypothetical protein